MFIITGATGKLGHAIIEKLIDLAPVNQIGATCRNPDKAADLTALGVRVRQGDFEDVESLRYAFEGATQVLIVSSDASAHRADPQAQHQTAITQALAAGAKRIVYTSQMAASASSAFPPMHNHAATEEVLRSCGVAWTALRNGFYGASGIAILGEALKTGILETAVDGPIAWTAHTDLAEAAAIILTQEQYASGPTLPFTGSQALDFGDLADIASGLLKRPISRQIVTDDELRKKLVAHNTPPQVVDIVLGLYIAARNHEFSVVDPALEQVLGRPPITMRSLMEDMIEC
jgi:NAD(P)H dehydrogenase (quinone)